MENQTTFVTIQYVRDRRCYWCCCRRKTWEAGPALVGVYATKKYTAGALGQYWWSFATQGGNKPHTSHGALLYFYFYNLPDAWQIGTNPTITYNNTATSGNQWNVPIGLTIGKTIKIGKTPVKIQLGVQKSVVNQDDFGQDWQIKLNITPVIPALVQRQLFQSQKRGLATIDQHRRIV